MKLTRRGTSHIELTVATLLLAATLATITSYRRQSQLSVQAAHSASLAHTRTLNLRCEIGSWPFEKIDRDVIEAVETHDSSFLPEARWVAEVTDIEEPIAGKQVILSLHWREGELERSGPRLTFWVKRP